MGSPQTLGISITPPIPGGKSRSSEYAADGYDRTLRNHASQQILRAFATALEFSGTAGKRHIEHRRAESPRDTRRLPGRRE